VQFTVRRMMVVVAILALAVFVVEETRKGKVPVVDASSGRFLLVVKTFRGPSARSGANALASELRCLHGLPTYTLTQSNTRRRQPGPAPESVAVLIGDCETKEDCAARRGQLLRIKSDTGLSQWDKLMAFKAANPYLPRSKAFVQQQLGRQ
jgi:hypothetical protein